MGRGYPPPQPTRESGERRKLPQRGPGQSPGRNRILGNFELEKTNLVMTNLIFRVKFTRLALIYIFFSFAGGQAPQAPSGYACTDRHSSAAILLAYRIIYRINYSLNFLRYRKTVHIPITVTADKQTAWNVIERTTSASGKLLQNTLRILTEKRLASAHA